MKNRILGAVLALSVGTAQAVPTVLVVKSTAYNSIVGQTDSNPFITATGTRTRPGVIAVSRDLLKRYPYGSRMRIVGIIPKQSCGLKTIPNREFIIEDTMAARKTNQVDIWFASRSEAINFGSCTLQVKIY